MAYLHLGQPGQHLSAQVQQFTTGKNVTLIERKFTLYEQLSTKFS